MRAALLGLAVLLAVPTHAPAHGMRTAYLELVEHAGGGVLVTWKSTVPDATVRPRLPAHCTPLGAETPTGPNTRAWGVHCPGGLAGSQIAIEGLGPVLTEAVVRVVRPDGRVQSRVLMRDAATWSIPAEGSWFDVGRQYVWLGIVHILEGMDHLLFLLALVLYVRRPRAVLVTETAFTISHTATFSATALGWIHVSAAAAEACIALSLILVALDAADGDAAGDPAWQGPLIALVFGLVHGLGFAGALGEVGLPDQAVASALIGFGLGVEIGQVAFLVAVLLGLWALRRAWPRAVPGVSLAGSYLVGVIGCALLFDRLRVCFA